MKISVTRVLVKASTLLESHSGKIRTIVLFFSAVVLLNSTVSAQNTIRVTGRVINEAGQPVANASVVVQSTSQGVTTNENGNYTLSIAPNGTLVISYVGLGTQEINVKNRTTINITLTASIATNLDQVVVVGYGTQKRRDVTGSVSSVGETALREVPVANLQGALQGRAAGLEIQSVGTTPGSGAQIRIRGTRSISGSNDPLLVLDGIPYDGNLNDINPDDVASVDVLKDASATAIYGSRGANGVIIVTTKRGRNGEAKISYNGYYGIGTVANKYPVFNPTEYRAMRDISSWAQGYEPEELASISKRTSTDWQDLVYQNSYKTDHNISVSGGSNGSTYSLGGGYYKENTVLPGQDFTRYTLRATVDSKVGKRIRIGLNSLNTVGVTNGSQFVNPMFAVLALSPLMPAYDSTGRIVTSPTGNNDDRQTQYSPLLLKNNNSNNWVDRVRRLRTFNSLYGEYQIISGLKYRVNLGLNYSQEEGDQFRSSDDPTGLYPSYFRPKQGNTAYVNNSEAWGYTAENLLTYDKTIGKHRINFTGLYSVQEYHTHNTSVTKDSITDNFVQFYNLGLSSPTPAPVVGGGETSWALLSYMGRINYAYDDRFLLTLTGRADGSSRLAPGHKWHDYPAVSAGWNISNEAFMKSFNAVSNLKVRVGFGQTSNQAINPYASLGLVSNGNGIGSPANVIRYNYGPTITTGYNVVTLPNPNLDWEYTKTINAGIDFGILKNRITGSIDYYHQHTDKILYSVTLPVTSGVSGAYTTNVGQMQNWGMELALSTRNIESPTGFSWNTDFNLFFNRNKLLKLSNNISKDIGSQLFVGYSMTSVYDYNKLGIWQTNEAAAAAVYGSLPGQIKLEDHSGPNGKPDGKIDANDQYILGNGDAKLQGGMTNRFAYKGLDLSFVIYARFGGLLVSQIHQPPASYLTVMDGKRNGIKVDYWTPTNPSNWFPEPSSSISPVSTAWTTLGYYDATFVKLRSINLGYTFSTATLKKISAQSIRVYATVDNVGTFFSPYMKQTGIDPTGTNLGNAGVSNPGNLRASSNNNGNGTITISASTPLTRSLIVGVNLSF